MAQGKCYSIEKGEWGLGPHKLPTIKGNKKFNFEKW
jgi:hypothetical protein